MARLGGNQLQDRLQDRLQTLRSPLLRAAAGPLRMACGPLIAACGPLIGLVAVAAIGCASAPPPPSFEDLPSAAELYQKGQQQVTDAGHGFLFFGGDYAKAIQTFQDIIDNYPYSEQAVLAELAIGDAYFAQEKYDEAISYYRDFVELHPEHEKVPYAMYRTVMSYYKQSRDPSRDQTATEEALTHLDRLLARFPHSQYAADGEKLWKELRTRLGKHTMQVADYYFDQDEYAAAADRYRQLLDQYPGLGLDADALYKLGVCYTRMHRTEEAQKIFQVILDNYKGTDVAEAAADLVPSAN
jgi:outer membrane protein assembly factor BamD